MPLLNIALKCSHYAERIALWAYIGLFSTKNTMSLNVELFIIFRIFVIRELTASLFISFSSSLPMSNIQISFSHLQPSKPPNMNNYFIPITHAVWRWRPAGAFSFSTGWDQRIESVFKTYKSLLGIIFLNDFPRPSYPPNRYILLPIRFAVWPLSPLGGEP